MSSSPPTQTSSTAAAVPSTTDSTADLPPSASSTSTASMYRRDLDETGAKQLYHQAVHSILDRWAGLQMAVSNGFCKKGPKTPRQHYQSLVQGLCDIWDNSPDADELDVEEAIEDFVAEVFRTSFEDGSLQDVSDLIVICLRECQDREFEQLPKVLDRAPVPMAALRTQIASTSLDAETSSSSTTAYAPVESTTTTSTTSTAAAAAAPSDSDSRPTRSEQQQQPEEDGWISVEKTRRKKKK